MKVEIREDLKKEFVFSTEDGIQIDNDAVYEAKYEEHQMLVYINGEYRKIEGIDFDIIEN